MKYIINVLGNLVDENKAIILENCPTELKEIIKDFQNEIDELEDKIVDKDKEIDDLENRVIDLEDKIEGLENQIDTLEDDSEYPKLLTEFKVLTGELSEANRYIEHLESELEKLKNN